MQRLEAYFLEPPSSGPSRYASSSASSWAFPPPSPTATLHDPFPYRDTSSVSSSPRPHSVATSSIPNSGPSTDPRSKHYVRYSLDSPPDGNDAYHRLADRHVRGQIVRKPARAKGKGAAAAAGSPEPGLEDGSAGVGSVLLSLGRGPEGSGKAVVVGNDILRIVQFAPPSDLPALPPPPHWVPLTFSTSNFAPSPPSSLTARPPAAIAAAPLPAPYDRKSNQTRRRSVPSSQRSQPRTPPPPLLSPSEPAAPAAEGTVLAEGPGKVTLREVASLKGLREATGGSGVVETRWGWGGQSSRVFVSGRKGNVMIWDVSSPNKMQSNITVDPTRRPISVMRFGQPKDSSPTATSLITGGHDAILRLYDFRTPSSSAALSHSLSPALASPITALAISPASALYAALGLENGTVGWIDWRRANRLVGRKFSAHGEGGVMSLDWKGDGRGRGDGWIASGGLDRKVHIWNLNEPTRPLHRTLRCAQPVSDVLWRPGHETELAVVPYPALHGGADEVEDASAVQIWDVRRGFFPKYVLEGGDGPASGVAWNDHGSLWAAYKTGTLVQHDVRHHTVPLQDLSGTSSTWTADGHLTFLARRQHDSELPFDDVSPLSSLNRDDVPQKSIRDDVYDPDQLAVEVSVDGLGSARLAALAGTYRMTGKDPRATCRRNAQVAADAQAWQDHQVWRSLEGMVDLLLNVREAEAARNIKPAPAVASALQDIPDLHLPPPRGTSPARSRGAGPAHALRDEKRAASGSRGPSRSPLLRPTHANDPSVSRRYSNTDAERPAPPGGVYAPAFAVGLGLAVEDSDLEEAVTLSSDSEEIESSSSSSSEDQLQTIPIPRQSRSKRSSFSSRRPSSSSQTRPAFASPLAPHTSVSASLSSRQASPHPNPRSYLRQFQARASPPQKARSNGGASDDDDDTPLAGSPQLSDDAYGVDPYGTGYGLASFMSSTSNATVTAAKATPIVEAQTSTAAARAPPARAPPSVKASPKPPPALAGRRSSVPAIEPLPTRLRTRRESEQQRQAAAVVAAHPAPPARVRQTEQSTLLDLQMSSRRAVDAFIAEYLDQGNPQMPSLIFIVCEGLIPLSRRRASRFITAYYELLIHLKLYVFAAKLRKHCGLPNVQEAVRHNTTTYLSCPRHPSNPLQYEDLPAPSSTIAWCGEDSKPAIICCFCSKAVFGTLAGCDRCGHGGHWACMETWWKTESEPLHPSTSVHDAPPPHGPDTPPALTPGTGGAGGKGSDSSPTTPAQLPARSEASGDGFGGWSGVEGEGGVVPWGWHCPTGCGCLCAVSHVGPPSGALPLTSQRSSVT